MTEHIDVVVVGAGISGVSAAWHLQERCPNKNYVILDKRENMGGTWDLFRYPGIRSDSDMYSLGFRFRPWTEPLAIAGGDRILNYIKSTAAMHGIDAHVRFNHELINADWSTIENCWTLWRPRPMAMTQRMILRTWPMPGRSPACRRPRAPRSRAIRRPA